MAFDPNQEFEIVGQGSSSGFDPQQDFEIVDEEEEKFDELIAPDGQVVKVPQSEGARLIVEEGYKTKVGAQAEQETFQELVEKSKATKGESALSGALSSLSFGFGTPASGIYEGLKDIVTGEGSLRGVKKSMEAAGLREQIEAAKNPYTYLGGAIGGSLLMPAYTAVKTPGIGSALLKAGAVGAGESALGTALREVTNPFDKPLKESAKEVGKAGGLGFFVGAGGGALAKRPEIKEAVVEQAKGFPEAVTAAFKAFTRGTAQSELPGAIPKGIEGLREVARTLSQRSAAKTLLATDKKQYLDEIGAQISSGTELGKQFVEKKASINDVVKNAVKNYVESKGVGIVANELAKAAGAEEGINTFEPIKNDLVSYLVNEKGLSEQQAKILVSVLPSNPLEVVGMIPGSTRMNVTDKKVSKIPDISDEEYILLRATESGPNKVKDLVTRVSSTLFGGRASESKALEEVMNIPLEQRVKARSFEPWEGAEEIKPTAMEASEAFQKGAVEQVQRLLPKAAEEFETAGPKVFKLANDFEKAKADAEILAARHPGIKKFIEDASEIWESGRDVSSAGLERGQYDQVDPLQRFMRLQRVRETIDDGIPYDQLKLRDPNEGEKVLLSLRRSADDVLKTSPAKVKSDAIYAEMKNTLKAVFGRTQFKGKIDTGKIEKMLRDTDEAKRFRSHFETLRKWASDETFSPEDRAKVTAFLDKFDSIYQMASQKQKIGKFEWKEGPSSAAVERLGGLVKKDSLTAELFASPRTALQKMDEFEKNYVNRWTNKNFGDLSLPERLAFIKLRNFMNETKENVIGFSDDKLLAKYEEFLDKTQKLSTPSKGGKSPGFGKFLTDGNIKGNIRDVVTDYMYSRGTKFLLEQGINQAFPEAQGSFEEMKADFKKYMMDEYGLTSNQADMINKVLPSNPMDLVGIARRIPVSKMGDVTNIRGRNRLARFYKDRGYGPTKGEVSDWIDEIKYQPKEKVQKSLGELLDSIDDPEDIESLMHLGRLVDDLELPLPASDKYIKKQKQLETELNDLQKKQNEDEQFEFDYDSFVDEFGKSPRNNMTVDLDGIEYKVSYVGDTAYLSPINYEDTRSQIDRLRSQINMNKYKMELTNPNYGKLSPELEAFKKGEPTENDIANKFIKSKPPEGKEWNDPLRKFLSTGNKEGLPSNNEKTALDIHKEKMWDFAKEVGIKAKNNSYFNLLDNLEAYFKKQAKNNPEISEKVFQIKQLQDRQKKDFGDKEAFRGVEKLREEIIDILRSKK